MTLRLVFGMLSEAHNLERESMSERDNLSAILGSIYDSVGSENGWDEALLTITKSFDSVVSNVFLRPPDQELYLVDTIATVRTHLKRVFSKTGVNRQSELVQLVLSSPAAL